MPTLEWLCNLNCWPLEPKPVGFDGLPVLCQILELFWLWDFILWWNWCSGNWQWNLWPYSRTMWSFWIFKPRSRLSRIKCTWVHAAKMFRRFSRLNLCFSIYCKCRCFAYCDWLVSAVLVQQSSVKKRCEWKSHTVSPGSLACLHCLHHLEPCFRVFTTGGSTHWREETVACDGTTSFVTSFSFGNPNVCIEG